MLTAVPTLEVKRKDVLWKRKHGMTRVDWRQSSRILHISARCEVKSHFMRNSAICSEHTPNLYRDVVALIDRPSSRVAIASDWQIGALEIVRL